MNKFIATLFITIFFLVSLQSSSQSSEKKFNGIIHLASDGTIAPPVYSSVIYRFDKKPIECSRYSSNQIDQFVFDNAVQKFIKLLIHYQNSQTIYDFLIILSALSSYDIDSSQNCAQVFYEQLRGSNKTVEQILNDNKAFNRSITTHAFKLCNGDYTTGAKPLHFVARSHNDSHAAKLFLDYGANPNVFNSERQTPLDVAILKNKRDLIALLMRYGGKPARSSSIRYLVRNRILRPVILPNPLIK